MNSTKLILILVLMICLAISTHSDEESNCSSTLCAIENYLKFPHDACPELNSQQFFITISRYPGSQFKKLSLNGLNNSISFNLISQWILPKMMNCELRIKSVDISNFSSEKSENLTNNITFRKELESVETLKMSQNCLQDIIFIFGPFTDLLELDLSFNCFTQIAMLTRDIEILEGLNMANNYINNITRGNFNNTILLENLNLSMNSLSIIPKDVFFDLKNMQILDLSHNSIAIIPELLFKQNFYLQFLKLNNNKIYRALPKDLFENTKNIKILDLSHNNIQTLNGVVRYLSNLEVLYLDYNGLVMLQSSDLDDCKNLNKITLSHNSFYRIPPLITVQTKNVHFDFRHNRYDRFFFGTAWSSRKDGTVSLDLSHNCIKTSDDNNCNYRNNLYLSKLRCSNCCLDSFEPSILQTVTNEIDFSHNYITQLDLISNCILEASKNILKINLTDNHISSLPRKHDPIWSKINELDLSYNKLNSLKNVTVSNKLTKLYLNNNNLTHFEDEIKTLATSNISVKLAGNPWKCNCEMRDLLRNSYIFVDKIEITCVKDGKIYNFYDMDELCSNLIYLWSLLPLLFVVLLVSTITILYNRHKSEILYFLFSRGICLRCVSEKDIDADKCYDAFISYHTVDEHWVANFLVPGLETGTPAYKLCLHNRDWLGGELIADQIVKSVERSRRTVIVLTEDFLKSEWSRMEFDIAYQQAIQDKVRRLIVVVPNQLPDLSNINNEFKTFITLTTYIEAKKPYFWRKLRASMPRVQNKPVQAVQESVL